MTRRSSVIVALLVVLAVAALAWGFVTSVALQAYPRPASEEAPLVGALWQCAMVGFLAVGGLVAAKRPRNPVGWAMLSLPVVFWVGFAQSTAADLAVRRGEDVSPLLLELDWVLTTVGAPGLLLTAIFLVVGFPDGRPTRRGRMVLRVAVPIAGIWAAARAVLPMPLDGSGLPSPHAIDALAPLVEAVDAPSTLLLLALLAGAVDLVLRSRRATGVEKQQFRWVVRSLLAAPLGFVLAQAGEATLSETASQFTDLLGIWVTAFAVAAGIGVAVLRYRLFDIDRIISRTLGYALVTAILVSVYAGAVLVLGGVARAVTGSVGDVVVALSTLLVAAAFQPVRTRVQGMVDRRFNRARYDAQRTGEVFAVRLRDEVDLSEVHDDLVGTVRTSLSPRTVNVWLPEETVT